MTDNEICKTVAKYIREHGWCQGEYHATDGRVCLVGALDSCFSNDYTNGEYRAVQRKLGVAGPLSEWNDQEGRTVEEVLTILESD